VLWEFTHRIGNVFPHFRKKQVAPPGYSGGTIFRASLQKKGYCRTGRRYGIFKNCLVYLCRLFYPMMEIECHEVLTGNQGGFENEPFNVQPMPTVLVVDDEVDICILLSAQLKSLGLQTSYCLTLKEANHKLSMSTYDLVFVDLNLTDGSGYNLIHFIRAVDKLTKIVVISAYEGERQKVLDVGASMFVPKPFTKKLILDALRKLKFSD
jgi:CheY-like chemotaxis protein